MDIQSQGHSTYKLQTQKSKDCMDPPNIRSVGIDFKCYRDARLANHLD